MAMVELSGEEVNIVPDPLLSHVDFKSLSPFKRVSQSKTTKNSFV